MTVRQAIIAVSLTMLGVAGLTWTVSAPTELQLAFQLRCSDEEIPLPGESFQVEVLLRFAPQGIQKYDLTFEVGDSGTAGTVARIEEIKSRTIRSEYFQVVSKTDFSVWFKALDVGNVIQAGATDVTIAVVTLRSLLPVRSLDMRLGVSHTSIDDNNQEIDTKAVLVLPTSCGSQ